MREENAIHRRHQVYQVISGKIVGHFISKDHSDTLICFSHGELGLNLTFFLQSSKFIKIELSHSPERSAVVEVISFKDLWLPFTRVNDWHAVLYSSIGFFRLLDLVISDFHPGIINGSRRLYSM